jgi:hypothetical protein
MLQKPDLGEACADTEIVEVIRERPCERKSREAAWVMGSGITE